MKTKATITNGLVILLLALWIPIGLYQVTHYDVFKSGILKQPFSYMLAWTLIYTLPSLHLATALLLVTDRYRRIGLLLSSILMTVYTGYIALALLGAWGKPPCNCGLAIPSMGWLPHLFFNLFFMAVSVMAYILYNKCNKKESKIIANLVASQGVLKNES